MTMTMTLNTPPQVEEANAVLVKLHGLRIGESITFDPPIPPLTVHVLYMLLQEVDKGWRITPAPEPKRSWWKSLTASMNQPVTMTGRPIPQTIAEIQRTR